MSNAPWDDDITPTQTRERDDDPVLDVTPTAIVRHEAQAIDVAALTRAAQSLGPRDLPAMRESARDIGTMLGGELRPDGSCAAYYSWEQGGKLIEGPTVQLMEALADVWGRLMKQVEILSEQDDGVIQLRATVVDLATMNLTIHPYTGAIMPTPGRFRRSPEQTQRWRVSQIQSNTSKAIRGALEHAIPRWMTLTAIACGKAAHAKAVLGNQSLGETIRKAVEHLGKHGLDEQVLIAWLDTDRSIWTIEDVARLRTLAEDLRAGRTTPDAVRASATGQREPTPKPAAPRTATPPADPPPPSSSTPGETTPVPPTSGGGQDEAKTDKPKAEPRDDERDAARLHDQLRTTRGPGTPVDMTTARRAMCAILKVAKISEDRWHGIVHTGHGKSLWSRSQNTITLAGKAEPTPPQADAPRWVVPDPWPGPMDAGVVLSRVRADLALIGTPGVREVMDAAGVASLDGADELGLRRLLCVTTTRLGASAPPRQEWEDPRHPMDPSLQADIEDLVRDTGDDVLCSAARVAGIAVDLAGPMVTPQTPPDQRRQFLAAALAMVGGR